MLYVCVYVLCIENESTHGLDVGGVGSESGANLPSRVSGIVKERDVLTQDVFEDAEAQLHRNILTGQTEQARLK